MLLLLLIVVAILFTIGVFLSSATYYRGPVSDHFDGRKFFNPYDNTYRPFSKFLSWQFTRQPQTWPKHLENEFEDYPPVKYQEKGIRLSFVGHATVLIQVDGYNILIDPVWSKRASPFQFLGPKRVNEPGVKLENLPLINLVLISHNHYDHLDIDTLTKLHKKSSPLFLTPLGNDTIIKDHIYKLNIKALDWFESHKFNDKVTIHLVPAVHWSSRNGFDRNKALWGGFIIETGQGNIYYSGDTALKSGKVFDMIYEKYGKPALAILPVGTYEPRWFMESAHINPEDAMIIHQKLGAPKALGVHYGTFQLSDESIDQQVSDFLAARKKFNVSESNFRILKVGEVWEVGG